ncbi:MAG: TIGR04222 domain-containing membrane protein, partial [Micromonosporaceae bacterium]
MNLFDGTIWEIGGRDFLFWYGVLALISIGSVLYVRRRGRGRTTSGHSNLEPVQAGLLHSQKLAIAVALTSLRARGAIAADQKWQLNVTGHLTPEANSLERALFQALSEGRSRTRLIASPAVSDALAALDTRLVDRGLLAPPHVHRRTQRAPLGLLPVWTLGVVCIAFGVVSDRPVVTLTVMTLIVAGVAYFLWRRPVSRVTRAGVATLSHLRTLHAHLGPDKSPALTTYGPATAAMAVALYGAAALQFSDRTFIETAWVPA